MIDENFFFRDAQVIEVFEIALLWVNFSREERDSSADLNGPEYSHFENKRKLAGLYPLSTGFFSS